MRVRLVALLGLACALGLVNTAAAQTTGRIVGTVLDQQNAATPGVLVTVSSPALQGTRSVLTDQSGAFRLVFLPPGTYALKAELSGFQTIDLPDVRVAIEQTATLNLTMVVAAITSTVTVTGQTSAVDVHSRTGGIVATADQFNNLPMQRGIYGASNLAAGVTADAVGATFSGSTGAENVYIIEGLNTTDARYGGIGKQVTFSFIDQVQVLTDGLNAEWGRLTGGAVNAITKSGSNIFRGSVFGFNEGGGLQSDNNTESLRPETTTTINDLTKSADGGFDLGGYIIQDRLWFYGAYDLLSQRNEATIIRALSSPGAPGLGSQIPTETTSHTFAGKLTLKLGSGSTVTGSVWGDPTTRDGALFAIAGPESTWKGTQDTGGTNTVVRWDAVLGSSSLLRAQWGQNRQKSEYGGPGTTQTQLLDQTVVPNARSGGFSFFQNNEFVRNQVKADFTQFLGSHEIMIGGDIERVASDVASQYGGGQLIYKLPPRSTTNGQPHYRHRYFVSDRASGFDKDDSSTWTLAYPLRSSPKTRNASLYVRDSFRVASNLTLNIGLRWEKQNLLDRDGKTAGIDEATGNPGINLNYWAPRLGFVWDPMDNARSKVFGSWGRYYESIPADIQIRAFGGEAICFCYNLSPDPAAVAPDESVRASALLGTGTEPVEPELKGQYIDEWVLGFEHEIMPNTTVGIKVARRNLGSVIEDFLVISEGNYFIANPGAGTLGQTVSFYDYEEAPAPKVVRENTDVQLTFRKGYSNNWQLLTSYTWQKLEGNYDGLFQNSTGQLDPNINSAFDYGDFMVNAFGPLTNQRRHQVKIDASYTLSGKAEGLTLGTSVRAYSGYPQTAYGYSFLYANWEYYLTPRGSIGTDPVEWEGDLHIGYPIRIGSKARANIVVDIFNLFNRQAITSRDQRYNLPSDGGCAGIPDGLCNGDNGLQHAPNSTDPLGQLSNVTGNAPNPDFLKAGVAFTGQRSIRLGVRFTF